MKCAHCENEFQPKRSAQIYCKNTCNKAAWKSRNKEQVREYYIKNSDHIRAKTKKWGKENAKRKQENNRKSHALNPDRANAYTRKWRAKNPDAMKIARESWNKENPDKLKALRRLSSNTRRARLSSCMVSCTKAIRAWEVKWRRKNRVVCFWCGGSFNPKSCHTDHIQPISKGGAHAPENLCISCSGCNLKKKAKTLNQWNCEIKQPALL